MSIHACEVAVIGRGVLCSYFCFFLLLLSFSVWGQVVQAKKLLNLLLSVYDDTCFIALKGPFSPFLCVLCFVIGH